MTKWWLTLFLVFCSFGPRLALAETRELSSQEYKVKAAFIYQFTNYIEWPETSAASADQPFVIAVYGDAPLIDELQALAKVKNVKNRPLQIIDAKDPSAPPVAQMVIVAADVQALQKAGAALKNTSTLIIAHGDDMAKKGAMINFFLEGERLRFEINRAGMDGAKLKPSSQLLKLSRLVD